MRSEEAKINTPIYRFHTPNSFSLSSQQEFRLFSKKLETLEVRCTSLYPPRFPSLTKPILFVTLRTGARISVPLQALLLTTHSIFLIQRPVICWIFLNRVFRLSLRHRPRVYSRIFNQYFWLVKYRSGQMFEETKNDENPNTPAFSRDFCSCSK